jgi:hypothetical protein
MAGAKAGMEQIEGLLKAGGTPVNGWSSAMHMFDYNADFFGIGTIDAPDWVIADRKKAVVTRAVACRGGLFGNHGYEADYAWTYDDADGNPLTGEGIYEFRLETLPPVDAFWSLTMYDMPNYYLVANPIGRYSVGSATPGLTTGADGSLTIVMAKDDPGPEWTSNWLPAPDGSFRPLMRMYAPKQGVVDGSYVLPAITRVG